MVETDLQPDRGQVLGREREHPLRQRAVRCQLEARPLLGLAAEPRRRRAQPEDRLEPHPRGQLLQVEGAGRAGREVDEGGEPARHEYGQGRDRPVPERLLRRGRAGAQRRPAGRVRLGEHQGLLAAGAGHPGLPDPPRLHRQRRTTSSSPGRWRRSGTCSSSIGIGGGIFFRVTANGLPVIAGNYADKGGHAIAGYHSFELNYLAHTYNRAFSYRERRDDNVFCMHLKPHVNSGQRSINVLPDFFGPDDLEVVGVVINGVQRAELRHPTSTRSRWSCLNWART